MPVVVCIVWEHDGEEHIEPWRWSGPAITPTFASRTALPLHRRLAGRSGRHPALVAVSTVVVSLQLHGGIPRRAHPADTARRRAHPRYAQGALGATAGRQHRVRWRDGVVGSQPMGWNGQAVKMGTVMAEVVVDVAGNDVVAAITAGSAERLSLAAGDPVVVLVKATEVLIGRE